MSSIKKVLIIKVIAAIFCIAVGVVSFFLIADKLGNVDFHADTINALDKSRSKVMELAAAAVASSSAITLLPGDVGTPIAQELADMSKYFLIVLCAIYLEKFLLTVTGFVAFKYVIPVACVLFIVFIASNEKIFKLLSFAGSDDSVSDPWYTDRFDVAFDDINRGIDGFLKYLEGKNVIN